MQENSNSGILFCFFVEVVHFNASKGSFFIFSIAAAVSAAIASSVSAAAPITSTSAAVVTTAAAATAAVRAVALVVPGPVLLVLAVVVRAVAGAVAAGVRGAAVGRPLGPAPVLDGLDAKEIIQGPGRGKKGPPLPLPPPSLKKRTTKGPSTEVRARYSTVASPLVVRARIVFRVYQRARLSCFIPQRLRGPLALGQYRGQWGK